jgi:ATP-dependent protease ClpP protease subunit
MLGRMGTADHDKLSPPATRLPSAEPQIRLLGGVDEAMVLRFLDAAAKLPGQDPVVVELTTTGGEADSARRLAQAVRELAHRREVFVLGKSYVYSAGTTVLAAVPRTHRWLTRDTMLLIHERRFERTVQLTGALRSAMAVVQDLVAEIEAGQQLERRGFAQLVEGSRLSVDELERRVLAKDWYLAAQEALDLGLVAGIAD